MKIYGYPGDRVDFVSASGSAGSVLFGDGQELCREFFGAPHATDAEGPDALWTYFSGALGLEFVAGALVRVVVTPALSREKVDVYLRKEKIDAATESQSGVEVTLNEAGDGVEAVVFSA